MNLQENNLTFQNVTDEENYQIWDAMGVRERRTAYSWKTVKLRFQAMNGDVCAGDQEGKMDIFTDDFKN